jgi:hypothetical protein
VHHATDPSRVPDERGYVPSPVHYEHAHGDDIYVISVGFA